MAIDTASRGPRRLRLQILAACLLLVSSPLVFGVLLGYYESYLIGAEQDRLRNLSEVMFGRSQEELTLLAEDNHLYVRVIGADGAVTYQSPIHVRREALAFFFGPEGRPDLGDFEDETPLLTRPEIKQAQTLQAADYWRLDHHNRTLQVFYRAVPWPNGQILYLTSGILRGVAVVHDIRWQLLNMTLPLALAALAVGLWWAFWIVSPLERMQQRIRRYLDGGPKEALVIERADEIGALSEHFQEMTDRLQGQLARTTHAIADLAHDFKNPVASILAGAEMLTDGEADQERVERIAKVIDRAGRRLQHSIDATLDLAKLEERIPKEQTETIDLADLARSVVETCEGQVRVTAEPALISALGNTPVQMLTCLIENALAFAERTVEVHVERVGAQVVLTVSDDGPGVSADNRDKVFKRFFSAREGGTGLGLAIAKTIAEAHHGELELSEDQPLGGACFKVTLPAAE